MENENLMQEKNWGRGRKTSVRRKKTTKKGFGNVLNTGKTKKFSRSLKNSVWKNNKIKDNN